jgi:hypothetical protein
MKKLILLLLAAMMSAAASAQEKGFTGALGFQTGSIHLNSDSKPFTSVEMQIVNGYNFSKRFTLKLPFESAVNLFDYADGRKDHYFNATLGLGASYNVVHNSEWGSIELALTGGSALGESDLYYLYYDAGMRWNMFNSRSAKMYIGFGVRYYDTRKAGHTDYVKLYAAMGFRFN